MNRHAEVVLRLPDDMVGQILDGLEIRAEQWEYTARFLETGLVEDGMICEECNRSEEAESIAQHYRRIIQMIWDQRNSTTK